MAEIVSLGDDLMFYSRIRAEAEAGRATILISTELDELIELSDRIGVIDDQGNILWGDQLMILFSRYVLKECPGAAIVGAQVVIASTGGNLTRKQHVFDDFIAAGDLLNWVLSRRTEGRSISFTDAHRLVALFFGAMGINEHAKVKVRTI